MSEVRLVTEQRAIVDKDGVHCDEKCYHLEVHAGSIGKCRVALNSGGAWLYSGSDGKFKRCHFCLDHARPYITGIEGAEI